MSTTDWEKRARGLLSDEYARNRREGAAPDAEVRAALQLGREMADYREVFARAEAHNAAVEEMAKFTEREKVRAADARAEEIARRLETHKSVNVTPHEPLGDAAAVIGRACYDNAATIARSTISKPGEIHAAIDAPGFDPDATVTFKKKPAEPGSIENPLPYGKAWKAGQVESLKTSAQLMREHAEALWGQASEIVDDCKDDAARYYAWKPIEKNPLTVVPDGTLSGTLPCGHGVGCLGVSHDDDCESKGIHCLECCGRIGKPKTREQRLEAALREIVAQEDGRPFPQLHSVEIARRALE